MLHGRHLLKEKGRWAIGSGSLVSIVEDNWLASRKKACLKEGCGLSTVKDLIDQSTNTWRIDGLREALHPSSAIEALKSPIGWFNLIDNLFWPPSKDGCYATV